MFCTKVECRDEDLVCLGRDHNNLYVVWKCPACQQLYHKVHNEDGI